MGLEAKEMWDSILPVTPVFVLTNGNRRLVEAFDQELQVVVFDLARDLVELARTMGRAIDVQVETGKWLRVRPDGTMSPTVKPASLKRVAAVRRKRARRLAVAAALAQEPAGAVRNDREAPTEYAASLPAGTCRSVCAAAAGGRPGSTWRKETWPGEDHFHG